MTPANAIKTALGSARRRALRRLVAARRDDSGIAATEFALILPVMVTLFFGLLEISDAMLASRKVHTAVNSLADLIAQERDISTAEIDQIMTGVQNMLQANPGSTLELRVTSVIRDPDDNSRLIVQWSRDNNNGTPYAVDSVFNKLPNPAVVNSSASLVVGEISYNHRSNLTNMFIRSPRLFDQLVTRWPRRTAEVTICGASPLPACVD